MEQSATTPSTTGWRRVNRSDIEWEDTYPAGHSSVVPVRWLSTQDPYIAEAKLSPWFVSLAHWHPFDTIYMFTEEGSMRMPAEPGEFSLDPVSEADDSVVADGVRYQYGDIRWVRGGTPYGPELIGPEGARFFVFSFGGEPTMGEDLAPVAADFGTPRHWRATLGEGEWHLIDRPDLDLEYQVLGDVGVHALLIRLGADSVVPAHWCDEYTVIVPYRGSFTIEGEGAYELGDVRICDRRTTYGPIRAGGEGAEFVQISPNGPLFYNWIE